MSQGAQVYDTRQFSDRMGLRCRWLVFALILRTVQRRRRKLKLVRRYCSWTFGEMWIFSNESRLLLNLTNGRWHIQRETSENIHRATIHGRVQAGGGSASENKHFLELSDSAYLRYQFDMIAHVWEFKSI